MKVKFATCLKRIVMYVSLMSVTARIHKCYVLLATASDQNENHEGCQDDLECARRALSESQHFADAIQQES